MTRRILTALYALLLTTIATAQPTVTQRTFTVHDGLAANLIAGIKQDSKGLMWIATWNGLCCYDGYQFTTFRGGQQEGDERLPTNRIAAIQPDSRDNIWVRTYNGALYLLDTRECRFVNIGRLVEQRYGEAPHPRNFYSLPTGHTWVSDENGKLNLRIDDEHPTDVDRMEVMGELGQPLYGKYIRKVEADDKGREWIITDKGRMLYGSDKRTAFLATDNSTPTDTALAWRLKACGKNTDDIEKHFIDHQGNLWYSTPHGLTLATFSNNLFHYLPVAEGQSTRSVMCRRDGTVWAGTGDGRISVYKGNTLMGWLDATGHIGSQPKAFADRIYTLFEDSSGLLWIGTKGKGLYTIDPQGKVSHYTADAGNRYAISSDNIYDVTEDADGHIWIGTYGGGLNRADRLQDGSLHFIHRGNELSGYPKDNFQRVRRISHDANGNLLLATTSGLLTTSAQTNDARQMKFFATQQEHGNSGSLLSSDVLQTLFCRNGDVYVATLGGGIQRIASKNLLQDGLKMETIGGMNQTAANALSMAEDAQGHIWIGRESGIECYSPDDGQLLQFGPKSTQERVELTEALPAISADGRMWFATTNGMLAFNTRDIRLSSYRPSIVFTNVQYQGERTAHPLLNRKALTIDRNHRNLTISFAALDYGDNALVQYAYKIKETDSQWNYIDNNPNIAFNQLPPGRHTLVVKSTNGDGVWVDNETELILDVTPMPWERTWVQLLLVLALIALSTWAVIVYRNYRLRTHEQEQRMESIMRQYRELQEAMAAREEEAAAAPSEDGTAAEAKQPLHKYTLEEPKIIDEDEVMMNQLMQYIEQHIADEDLRIEDMAEAVNMGRTVFYGKVKSLVGMSPSDFLRQVRMQRAVQLVEKSHMTISEVAYAIGFTDPKYFTKCFKKQTGMTPSEYRAKGEEGQTTV